MGALARRRPRISIPRSAWLAQQSQRGSSGFIEVSGISATRVSGSFSFTMVQRIVGEVIGVPPPPPTKHIEGTFDVEINDRVVCP
jgi:hypothetical protein